MKWRDSQDMSFSYSLLNSILWVFLMAGIGGAVFLALKKIPAILSVPENTIENQETFFEYMERTVKGIPHKLREWEIAVLEKSTKNLFKFKILSLKIHNGAHYLTEILNRRLHRNRMLNSARNDEMQKLEEANQPPQEIKE